jgi:DNA-binding transcriptional regulator GbsR (MarR family)
MSSDPLHDEPLSGDAGLNPALSQFVHLWSEMAAAWGINRTMAQIHALLYAEAVPMNTDDIMERLDISRGNANMNLRELLQWDLIHKVVLPGDRKDYYLAVTDVWTIVSRIAKERQQREISPVLASLKDTMRTLEGSDAPSAGDHAEPAPDHELKARIQALIDFLEMFERFTSALLPYVSRQNLGFMKSLVRLAEAGQILRRDPQGGAGDSQAPGKAGGALIGELKRTGSRRR